MTDQCAPNAFFAPTSPTEVRLGWFGRDAEWAVAEGHLDPGVFAAAVDGAIGSGGDGVDPGRVIHAHAVLTEDTTVPVGDDLRWCIRWNGITKDTANAFLVTAVDTSA